VVVAMIAASAEVDVAQAVVTVDQYGHVRTSIHVSHFPPGTSKWKKIEHRLFSFIAINWRGRPLRTYETVINLIGNTTNRGGLVVRARLDRRRYPTGPTGKKISAKDFCALKIERDDFHGDWNYVVKPRKEME
jgi:hypothetical protein